MNQSIRYVSASETGLDGNYAIIYLQKFFSFFLSLSTFFFIIVSKFVTTVTIVTNISALSLLISLYIDIYTSMSTFKHLSFPLTNYFSQTVLLRKY